VAVHLVLAQIVRLRANLVLSSLEKQTESQYSYLSQLRHVVAPALYP
jgi:hypothetical protein